MNNSGWNIKTSRTLLISGCKSLSPPGTVVFRFQQKIKAIKAKIHTWNREEFGNIFEDKKKLLNALDLINKQGMEVGWDEDMKAKEKDLMSHLKARERQEGIFWQ